MNITEFLDGITQDMSTAEVSDLLLSLILSVAANIFAIILLIINGCK